MLRSFVFSLFVVVLSFSAFARTQLEITIDKDDQRMEVVLNGRALYRWSVSTGREQWETSKSGRQYYTGTPVGVWRPASLQRHYYSKTWQAEMPYSIFIVGGIAIHGIDPALNSKLGTPASGGCVRLALGNARKLFELVTRVGMSSTTIEITEAW